MSATTSRWRGFTAERVRLLRLLADAGPRRLGWLAWWHLLATATPPLTALATGWLVHEVVHAVRNGGGVVGIVAPLVAVVVLFVATELAESGQEMAGLATAGTVDRWIRRRVRDIALGQRGITHLEDESFQDDVMRVSQVGGQRKSPGAAAVGQVVLLFRMLGAVAAAAIVSQFSVVLAVLLLGASLLVRARVRRQWLHLASLFGEQASGERRVEYWSAVTGGPDAAKEIRLFGLGGWLVARRREEAMKRLSAISSARGSVVSRQGLTVVVSFGCAVAVLLWPGIAAANGEITPAELVTCLVAGWAVLAISAMGREPFDIEYGLVAVRAFDSLLAGHPAGVVRRAEAAEPRPAPAVRLDKVTFTYPGSSTPVLDQLTMEIRPGEVLGVVGPNGAGKTTMTKLLAGLYEPTGGRVLVDGADLSTVDIDGWRARVAAIFQDFVRYPATVGDNVALSAPECLADEAAIEAALDRAGAARLVAGLPLGVRTPLWKGTAGGVDLSGGQWQKIAIARAVFAVGCGRRLLILDEPTAHLDVNAEAEFFAQVIDAVRGASVVLISHRLSTVRRADRIVLLSGGRVTASGSHDELMRQDGEYARLFRLQASRFATERATT